MARYMLDTEHIRGEPRIYWVTDLSQRHGRWPGKAVTDATTDKRKAERDLEKLVAASTTTTMHAKED